MLKQKSAKENKFDTIIKTPNLYIDQEVDTIKTCILNSKNRSTYINYHYNSKKEKDSDFIINDDWHFCIFICKFIKTKELLSNIALILESFLYNHRYHKKFDNDSNYLKITINKVITLCIEDSLMGSLLPRSSEKEEYHVSGHKSIDRRVILKVCNILSPFFLDKISSTQSSNILIHEDSIDPNNNIKVEMLGGLLNSFDLCVFLSVVKESYNQMDYDLLRIIDLYDELIEFDIKMSLIRY